MKAVQYTEIGGRPHITEVPKPTPGPGEVLLKMTAAGLCHSDEYIMSVPKEVFPYKLPQTLGHEPAGVVAELGPGVSGVEIGEPVIVYGCWGCGICRYCADGSEGLCHKLTSPGLGRPGAMAEYMIVDSPRHLVPIGDLDPVKAASLTDAALTPYQAICSVLPKIRGGQTILVIGAGGLGHVAIQLLKQMTSARVVAFDLGDERLDFAKKNGADYVFESNEDSVAEVRKMTNDYGVDVVFDFVGADVTGNLAIKAIANEGSIVICGAGGGGAKNSYGFAVPLNVCISTSNWGRRSQLMEVVEMAKRGQLHIATKTYTMNQAEQAYQDLHDGKILGRGVVLPNA